MLVCSFKCDYNRPGFLLRYSDKLARRIFPPFPSITLTFSHLPRSTSSTSITHWIGLISVTVLRRHRTLSANIGVFSKSALWILTIPKPRSVFISSTLVFFHLGILLTVSGECTQCFYIGFLMSHRAVYSFGPAATLGHSCLPWLPPPYTLDILPGFMLKLHGGTRLINNTVGEISTPGYETSTTWYFSQYIFIPCSIRHRATLGHIQLVERLTI